MIEINLLPAELKVRKQRLQIPSLPIIPIAAAFGGVLVLFYVCTLLLSAHRSSRLEGLQEIWQKHKPAHNKMSALQKELGALRAQKALVDQISGTSIGWARILNILSDCLPEEVWFNRIVYKEQGSSPYMEIYGTAERSVSRSAVDSITAFVETLRRDAALMKVFQAIELGAMERRDEGQLQTVQFTFRAPLEEREDKT